MKTRTDRAKTLTTVLIGIYFLFSAPVVHSQGGVAFNNGYARTRIGSTNGPYAYAGIWAQMLAGITADSLAPIGQPAEHFATGIGGWVNAGSVVVPGIPACEIAYVKMVAWDGQMWGTSLAGVPPEWLGMTDTVSVMLGGGDFPCEEIPIPRFTQPAVVPIPEPSITAMVILAGALCLGMRGMRRSN